VASRIRIYITPKRGRLPRRYEVDDQRTPQQKLRWLALWLSVGAAFWGGVWYVASR
jgi:hypothetical protein